MEKNFVARIMANISEFQRNVRKAQKLARTSIPKEIETDIDADISKFRKGLLKAKALAQRFREHTVHLKTDNKRFNAGILMAKATLAQLDTANENFQRRMDKMANAIRSFGTVFSNQVKGLMIASIQGLIPIIAGLVPVIMAVGNALKVVTGGAIAMAGALAIGAGGFVGFAGMAVSAISMLNDGILETTKETRKYESALQGVKDTWTDIIRANQSGIFNTMANGLNAVKSSMKQLTPFLSGVTNELEKASQHLLDWTKNSATAKAFFKAMGTTGVSIFNDLLNAGGRFGDGLVNVFTQLMPLFKWSSQWLERLGTSFSNWANSVSGQNAIKNFMEYTKENLPIMGKIFSNTFAGINNLLKAFGSNSTDIFKSLEQMTQRFREWSETVGKSEGFKKFIEYMNQNGPKIMSLIGNIIMLLVNFGVAMAPIASKILDVVNALVEFTSNLFEAHPGVAQLLGVLTIFGGILLALVPTVLQLAGVITDLIIPFVRWASKVGLGSKAMNLLKGVFGKLVNPMALVRGALTAIAGALGAITTPVWIVIGAILALIGIFVTLWKTNEDFRNMCISAWEAISNAVTSAIQAVTDFVMQIWGQLVAWWEENNELIMSVTQTVWQTISDLIMAILNLIVPFIQQAWNTIVFIIQTAWELIKVIVQVGLTFILGLIKTIMQILQGDWSGAWETIKQTAEDIWVLISDTAKTIWGLFLNYLKELWNNMLNFAMLIWNNMKETVISKVQEAYNGARSWVIEMWSMIQSKFQEIVDTVRNKMQEFKDTIEQKVRDAYNAVVQWVTDFYNAGKDLIMGLINGVKDYAGQLADEAGKAVSNALNRAKSLLGGGGGGLGAGMNVNLIPNQDITGLGGNIASSINVDMPEDVRHSLQENARPQVNVTVHNEGDIEFIKSWIEDEQAKRNNTFY
ncbi:phage tail protein [Mammaliicoccus sciuri]|uniref:phage tail protein n=1 Tax=Mammaliicoccus sciuri TaxID=1296 RepID=UPI001628CA69|nr:terminase [Mammaliicoccus sciuri]